MNRARGWGSWSVCSPSLSPPTHGRAESHPLTTLHLYAYLSPFSPSCVQSVASFIYNSYLHFCDRGWDDLFWGSLICPGFVLKNSVSFGVWFCDCFGSDRMLTKFVVKQNYGHIRNFIVFHSHFAITWQILQAKAPWLHWLRDRSHGHLITVRLWHLKSVGVLGKTVMVVACILFSNWHAYADFRS